MVDGKNLAEEADDGFIDCDIGDYDDYYLKDESLKDVEVEGKFSSSTNLIIENCDLGELVIKDVRNVSVINTNISGFESLDLSFFENIGDLLVQNCSFDYSYDERDEEKENTGTYIKDCKDVVFEDTKFSCFKHGIVSNRCSMVLRNVSFSDIKWWCFDPINDTTFELYDLEFENVGKIMSYYKDCNINVVESCPELVLERL